MIGCIVQARMGSSRLPGKTLMTLDKNTSTLHFVINQILLSKLVGKIVVATTNLAQDDIIENECKQLQIECFRGHSTDVLDRYYNCSKFYKFDNIVRITSDCPLIDPQIIDKIIGIYTSTDFDYYTNTLIRTFPIGTDVEIFSFDALEKAWKNAKLPSEREHVTPFIRNKKMDFKVGNLENTTNLGFHRWTLDHKEDLELIQKIISKIHKRPILMNEILNLLSLEPELNKINQHIPQNEGMLKSLKKDNDSKNY